jgi:hypothetical protein
VSKKNYVNEAYLRFIGLLDGKMKKKEIDEQFTYFMSGKAFKEKVKKEDKEFVPLKISKLTSRFIRTGRIA